MADYGADANAIYDPQAAGERTLAGQTLASSQSDIAASKAELTPYYANAFSALQTGEDKAQGTQTQADNLAGLLDSGLHANQAMGITKQYASDRSNLSTEQANKIAAYNRQGTNAQNAYQATLSSILDKYNGYKASYVSEQQGKEADRAFQAAQAEKSAQLSRDLAASSNANAIKAAQIQASAYNQPAQPTAQDKIMQTIQSGLQGYGGVLAKGYTEKTLIPKIKSLSAQYGVDPNAMIDMMYQYRKSTYGG